MKSSNVFMEDEFKKALDEKSEETTTPSAIDRNADILRFFEQNMREKKMIETNKSKVQVRSGLSSNGKEMKYTPIFSSERNPKDKHALLS